MLVRTCIVSGVRGAGSPRIRCRPDRREAVIQRLLVRHGVDRDKIDLLAADMRRALKQLNDGHPRDATRTGFRH